MFRIFTGTKFYETWHMRRDLKYRPNYQVSVLIDRGRIFLAPYEWIVTYNTEALLCYLDYTSVFKIKV